MATTGKYTILKDHLEDAINRLSKVARKFNKKHGVSFSYTISDTYIKKIYGKGKRQVVDVEYSIEQEELKYEGYTYVATLKVASKTNEVFPTDGFEDEDFTEYFDMPFRCDHCDTNRARKTVHLFRDEDGEDLMIAKSCARDYFGIEVETTIRSILWALDTEKFFGGFDGYNESTFDSIEFTKIVFGMIKKDGQYISGVKAAEEEKTSTGDMALNYTDSNIRFLRSFGKYDEANELEYKKEGYIKAAEDKGFDIEEYFNYWENVDYHVSDFMNKCRNAVFGEADKTGMRAYSVWHIIKEELKKEEAEKAKKEQALKVNEYIGTVGEKQDFTAKVLRSVTFDTMYGTTTAVTFEDSEGRQISFFDNKAREYNKGEEYSFKAKVKAHEEYKGIKQTKVFYVKFNKECQPKHWAE